MNRRGWKVGFAAILLVQVMWLADRGPSASNGAARGMNAAPVVRWNTTVRDYQALVPYRKGSAPVFTMTVPQEKFGPADIFFRSVD
ncbi:MAG TPA: hypothetical protein DIU14_06995 [Actinobacteria bacterium]|nr:hypothetical protein [Actinomycetota bacterium]